MLPIFTKAEQNYGLYLQCIFEYLMIIYENLKYPRTIRHVFRQSNEIPSEIHLNKDLFIMNTEINKTGWHFFSHTVQPEIKSETGQNKTERAKQGNEFCEYDYQTQVRITFRVHFNAWKVQLKVKNEVGD
jgi:hypothetical protein